MNHKLAYVIFIFAFVVSIAVGFFSPSSEEHPQPSEFREKFQETILKPLSPKRMMKSSEIRSSAAEKGSLANAKADEDGGDPLEHEAFLRKYGDQLKIEKVHGRVTRMDGASIRSDSLSFEQKVKAFRPSQDSDLVARAKEVLRDARKLIGAKHQTEFGDPIITPGESTGQVTFQQTIGGVPLLPGGTVTLLLGPEGELRALDSSVYPETEIHNTLTLPRPDSSRTVLFVSVSDPKGILRYAYETIVRGTKTITDAQTGEVLLTRDIKIY